MMAVGMAYGNFIIMTLYAGDTSCTHVGYFQLLLVVSFATLWNLWLLLFPKELLLHERWACTLHRKGVWMVPRAGLLCRRVGARLSYMSAAALQHGMLAS